MSYTTPQPCYTGSWGSMKLSEKLVKEGFNTTYSETFNAESLKTIKEGKTNEFSQFKTLKSTGMATLARHYVSRDEPESEVPILSTTESHANLDRTIYTRKRSENAPVAIGRSGTRVERGTSCSGLLGERLQLDSEPRINSLVQRSWMYCDDPALMYKINGCPPAAMPNDVSLAIGYDPAAVMKDNRSNESEKKPWSWHHERKSTITAEPTARSLGVGKRVFRDDPV